jgi:heme oxygenase
MSGLAARLREETRPYHSAAERAGIMTGFLRGQIDRATYTRLLRNLHALYDALESSLARFASSPFGVPFEEAGLRRREALASDAEWFGGSAWRTLPVEEAMQQLVHRIVEGDAVTAATYAYVRYLGDVSGGQALKGVVRRIFALPDERGTAFYSFPELGDLDVFKGRVRADIDALPVTDGGDAMVREAIAAFQLHERLFVQLDLPLQPVSSPAA